MEYFPLLEVLAQCIYAELDSSKRTGIKKYVESEKTVSVRNISVSEIVDGIKEMGVREGDIVLIHSSMGGLKSLNGSPAELIDGIMKVLGEEGTLAMAAFPHFKEKDYIEKEGVKYILYNVKKTGVSTGLLPMVFCKMQGVRRSCCPMNSVAAWGKLADEMLQNELQNDLVHGVGSAWHYLAEHHAKVLYLGLRIIDADTIVHVVEDVMDTEWPIEDWYERNAYIIKNGQQEKEVMLRVRRGFWHRFFVAHYSGRLIRKNQFALKKDIGRIHLELVKDVGEYVDFLKNEACSGRLLYRIPRRYWKRRKKNG